MKILEFDFELQNVLTIFEDQGHCYKESEKVLSCLSID